MISPFVFSDMEQYLLKDKLHSDLIIEAMKEAVQRNKRNWKYVTSILRDCCNNNIKTAQQFKIKQEEFRLNKNNQSAKKEKAKEKAKYEEIQFKNEEEYRKKLFEKQKG